MNRHPNQNKKRYTNKLHLRQRIYGKDHKCISFCSTRKLQKIQKALSLLRACFVPSRCRLGGVPRTNNTRVFRHTRCFSTNRTAAQNHACMHTELRPAECEWQFIALDKGLYKQVLSSSQAPSCTTIIIRLCLLLAFEEADCEHGYRTRFPWPGSLRT